MQAVCFAVKIPFFSGAKMVHKTVIVLLHDDTDIFHTAVNHAGNQKVYDTETSCHRQCCYGADDCQFAKTGVIFTGIDNSHYIFHFCLISLSVHFNRV